MDTIKEVANYYLEAKKYFPDTMVDDLELETICKLSKYGPRKCERLSEKLGSDFFTKRTTAILIPTEFELPPQSDSYTESSKGMIGNEFVSRVQECQSTTVFHVGNFDRRGRRLFNGAQYAKAIRTVSCEQVYTRFETGEVLDRCHEEQWISSKGLIGINSRKETVKEYVPFEEEVIHDDGQCWPKLPVL